MITLFGYIHPIKLLYLLDYKFRRLKPETCCVHKKICIVLTFKLTNILLLPSIHYYVLALVNNPNARTRHDCFGSLVE